jgi:hypothetical protein
LKALRCYSARVCHLRDICGGRRNRLVKWAPLHEIRRVGAARGFCEPWKEAICWVSAVCSSTPSDPGSPRQGDKLVLHRNMSKHVKLVLHLYGRVTSWYCIETCQTCQNMSNMSKHVKHVKNVKLVLHLHGRVTSWCCIETCQRELKWNSRRPIMQNPFIIKSTL